MVSGDRPGRAAESRPSGGTAIGGVRVWPNGRGGCCCAETPAGWATASARVFRWSGRIAVQMTTISPLLLVTDIPPREGDPRGHRCRVPCCTAGPSRARTPAPPPLPSTTCTTASTSKPGLSGRSSPPPAGDSHAAARGRPGSTGGGARDAGHGTGLGSLFRQGLGDGCCRRPYG